MIDFTRGDTPRDRGTPGPLSTLTTKQRQLLEAIDGYCQATGEPCSANYLARRFAIHHTTIREHIEALYRRGWLTTPRSPVYIRRKLSPTDPDNFSG
jgi:DNA-binding MarR family transcriptional regulator